MITVNMMVRNEPLVFFALSSVAPFVEKVLVCDTGSDDHTREDIELAASLYSNITFLQKNLTDTRDWSLKNLDHCAKNWDLTNVRRELQEMSETEFVMVVDGDEVYPTNTINEIVGKELEPDKIGGFVPMLWFSQLNKVFFSNIMGRVWRKDAVYVDGPFPCEMHHCGRTKKVLDENSISTQIYSQPCFHYETMLKPWRRKISQELPFKGYPEVFLQYENLLHKRIGT